MNRPIGRNLLLVTFWMFLVLPIVSILHEIWGSGLTQMYFCAVIGGFASDLLSRNTTPTK